MISKSQTGYLALSFLFIATTSCKSVAVKDPTTGETIAAPQAIVIPKDYTPAIPAQLTTVGYNGESYFSPDGTKLIFQSKKRPSHANSQIYTLDLKTGKEKRITHHDGEDTCSYYSPDGTKIIYASTTDEIKEHPETTPPEAKPETQTAAEPKKKKYEWKFLPYEIYQADADGSHTTRLTHSQGYDAEGVYSNDGKNILFTSIRDGDLELYTMHANGTNQRRLTFTKGYDGGGFYSPNGQQIAWRGFHDEKGNAQLFTADKNGKHIKQLTNSEAINWCPFWHPDGKKIIFSSNRGDKSNFEIYQINSDGTCLKRLTYSPGADILPVFSLDGKKIAFTSNRSGSNQLYVMDYVEPKDCLSDIP